MSTRAGSALSVYGLARKHGKTAALLKLITMSVTVYIIISILLVLGIIFTVFSIKMAEVDEEHLEGQFDPEAFSKPSGWKVGKLPEELKHTKNPVRNPRMSGRASLFSKGSKLNETAVSSTTIRNA